MAQLHMEVEIIAANPPRDEMVAKNMPCRDQPFFCIRRSDLLCGLSNSQTLFLLSLEHPGNINNS